MLEGNLAANLLKRFFRHLKFLRIKGIKIIWKMNH